MNTTFKPSLTNVNKALSTNLFAAVKDLFFQSWHATVAGWRRLGLIWVYLFVGVGITVAAVAGLAFLELFVLAGLVGFIFGVCLLTWFSVVMLRASYAASEGRIADWDELHSDIVITGLRFIGATIVYAVICLTGLFLFVIPAIIWFHMFSQVSYAVIVDKMAVGDAFRYSKKITDGKKLSLAVIVGLASIFWVAVGQAAQGIGMLVDLSIALGGNATFPVFGLLMNFATSIIFTPLTYVLASFVYKSLKK